MLHLIWDQMEKISVGDSTSYHDMKEDHNRNLKEQRCVLINLLDYLPSPLRQSSRKASRASCSNPPLPDAMQHLYPYCMPACLPACLYVCVYP